MDGNTVVEKRCTQRPTAIVLADQVVGGELDDIFGRIPVASLVVAGKTVVEHTLQELQELGFQQCIVLAGENAEELQASENQHGRLGMTVTIMNYPRTVDEVMREYKSLSEPNGLLVIEANAIRSFCIADFLSQADMSEYSLLEAKVDDNSVGITLLKPTEADFIINAMPINLLDVKTNLLRTAVEFHAANFDVVSDVFNGLDSSVMVNRQVGRRQHWSSHVSTASADNWVDVMIEKHCQIGKRVSMNSVILNHDVYVENQAELNNTIVMPNSIVSAARALDNSIVHRGAIFELN